MFCPLDCWDSCQLKLENGKFKGTPFTPFLCWKLNNYFQFPPEQTARWKGRTISIEEGLEKLAHLIETTPPDQILYLKGSGNMGFFSSLPLHFFGEIGAVIAVGSTCDGIGSRGVSMGRGNSLILPLWIIEKARNVILWGRNPAVTNPHLLPLLKGKKVAVIDVYPTKTARLADRFIRITPNRDYFLAILLAKWVVERREVRNRSGVNLPTYLSLLKSYSEKELLEWTGIQREEGEWLLERLLEGAVILTGLGVAKCPDCWKTTWAIDSLAQLLDYFGKGDRGVAFLGSSSYGLYLPFRFNIRRTVPLFDINLDRYQLVVVQGANPLISFPNRPVWEKLREKKVVVFGRYWDETAQLSTLFIPAEGFYNKSDVRGSYFHEYVAVYHPLFPPLPKEGISEYDLTQFLLRRFNLPLLPSIEELIGEILSLSPLERVGEGLYRKKVFDTPPYSDQFYTPTGKFHFLTARFTPPSTPFHLVTAKWEKSLNSQFRRFSQIRVNPTPTQPVREWLSRHLSPSQLVTDRSIPADVVVAPGGVIANRFYRSSGPFASYTDF